MTDDKAIKLIKSWHGETKYPSGARTTMKIELFDDGQLIQTEKDDDLKSTILFYKKYKRLNYAKKKMNILRDEYLDKESNPLIYI